MSRHHKVRVLDTISRWTDSLPEELRLFQKSSTSTTDLQISRYDFKARQLHIPYFVVLTIMHKTLTPNAGPSAISILAASYIAGIFEDFLARDEISHLPAIFTFYGLAAGVSLISFRRYPHLREVAEQDLEVIMTAEVELAKRWPTARGMKAALQNMMSSIPDYNLTTVQPPLDIPISEIRSYFSAFGPMLCRMRDAVLGQYTKSEESSANNHHSWFPELNRTTLVPRSGANGLSKEPLSLNTPPSAAPVLEENWNDSIFNFPQDDMGFWLFENGGQDFPLQ